MARSTTDRYVDECTPSGSRLRYATRGLDLPDVYARSYGGLLLDRPVFAAESEISAFADDLSALFDLLVSLPDRVFGGDLGRFCAALGMDGRLADLIRRGATGRPPLYARADAYHDGDAFRLLELNVGSELGGPDTAQLNRALLRVPEFADFAERWKLGHIDTVGRLAGMLRRAAADIADGEPVVALVESTGGIAAHEHVFLALQEALADHGVNLLLGEIHELGERDGKAVLRDEPLDVVLRYFVAGELLDSTVGQQALDTLVRAAEAGRTALFTPLEGAAYASKGALGMLHDPRIRETFSGAECAVVDRVVPWTRLLNRDAHTERGHAELLERCRSERSNLVLKPGVGYGGVGTLVGSDTDDESWHQALLDRSSGDHVVQERIRPACEPVVNADTGAVEDWVANWGVFVDSEGYAGGFVRALKPSDGSIVSYSNPGTRGTCVFTVP